MRYKHSIFYLLAIGLFISSCGERDYDIYDGPNQIHFVQSSADYFVLETDDPGYQVQLGSLKPSDGNISANILIDEEASTAVEGTHYTISSTSKTIDEGEAIGSITVNGIFENLDSAVTLVLHLQESESLASFNRTFTLTLTQFCPYIQSEFVGTYSFTSTLFGGTFPVEVVAGSSENEIVVQNMYEDGFNVTIEMDDSNPAAFTADVDKQDAWVSPQYGQARAEGGGTFNACEKTITLDLEHTVDAGTFGVYREVLVKD